MPNPISAAETRVTFVSEALQLSGIIRTPEHPAPCEKLPAFIVLHGFGSNKNAGNVLAPCRMLDALGYITLRFDMRGCGESQGERGRVICLEQVSDTRNALTFLASHPQVDP